MSLIDTAQLRQGLQFDCGPAAAAIVCRAFDIIHPRSYYRKLLGTNGINGTDPRTIESFLRNESLKVISGEMDIEDVAWFTGRGRPVILLVTLDSFGHYIVGRGLTGECARIHYQDPESGRRSMPTAEFLPKWVDHDRFGYHYKQFGMAAWK